MISPFTLLRKVKEKSQTNSFLKAKESYDKHTKFTDFGLPQHDTFDYVDTEVGLKFHQLAASKTTEFC